MSDPESVVLEITDVAYGGDGVGRLDNLAVFVPYTLPGERIEARIVSRQTRFARAQCTQILSPSPHRIVPPCPYFVRCEGCRYQHADYATQLQMKQKQVRDALTRLGGFDSIEVGPCIPSPLDYGYRNKIKLHGPGRPAYSAGHGALIPIAQCPLADAAINAALKSLTETQLRKYQDLTIRSDSGGHVVAFTHSQARGTDPAKDSFQRLTSTLPPDADNRLTYNINGLILRVPLRSFFQVNTALLPALIGHAGALIQARGCTNLIDAFCGVGLFSIALAGRVKQVEGWDVDEAGIAAARENADRTSLDVSPRSPDRGQRPSRQHCRFATGPAEKLLAPALRETVPGETCVLLDPPRGGCVPALVKTLVELKPRQILYISCAPPMLARDAQQLCRGGYRLERVTPFDLFPQTGSIEAVAEFIRQEG